MLKNIFRIHSRAHNVIIDADSLPEIQSLYDKKKELKSFGAKLRYVQKKIAGGYLIAIALLVFGVYTSWNGVIQPNHEPMTFQEFKHAEIMKGYVDITAYITNKYGENEKTLVGMFDGMDLEFFLIVNESYTDGEPVFGVLGMTKGHLRRLAKDNPEFDENADMNNVRFTGLATGTLPETYLQALDNQGVNIEKTFPLIIAYQSKSVDLIFLKIFAVISIVLMIILMAVQYVLLRKYLPQLSEYEIFIQEHRG